jgi:hypothetical protein
LGFVLRAATSTHTKTPVTPTAAVADSIGLDSIAADSVTTESVTVPECAAYSFTTHTKAPNYSNSTTAYSTSPGKEERLRADSRTSDAILPLMESTILHLH